MDLRYMSRGGLMLDGTGDIAGTLTSTEELTSMVDTRVKAAVNAWKLYQGIGAGLDVFEGQPVNNNTELSIQRAVTAALTQQFLPSGAVQVQTVAIARFRRGASPPGHINISPTREGRPTAYTRPLVRAPNSALSDHPHTRDDLAGSPPLSPDPWNCQGSHSLLRVVLLRSRHLASGCQPPIPSSGFWELFLLLQLSLEPSPWGLLYIVSVLLAGSPV